MKNKLIKNMYSAFILIFIWFILHHTINPFVIPNPLDVFIAFFENLYPTILINLFASFYRLAFAMAITLSLGYVLGILLGVSKKADTYISPIIYALYPIPRIAFLPIFMILFGLKDKSKIILIVTISIFLIIITIRDGVKDIPKDFMISANTLNLTKWQVIKHIIIPATLPNLFTGLRIVLGSCIAALFFAESYGAKYGIGYYIMENWAKVDYVNMYGGILSISLLGIALFKTIDIFEKHICKWNK